MIRQVLVTNSKHVACLATSVVSFDVCLRPLSSPCPQLVSCLQPRHSKYAYQLLAKAADPAKAARGWR